MSELIENSSYLRRRKAMRYNYQFFIHCIIIIDLLVEALVATGQNFIFSEASSIGSTILSSSDIITDQMISYDQGGLGERSRGASKRWFYLVGLLRQTVLMDIKDAAK